MASSRSLSFGRRVRACCFDAQHSKKERSQSYNHLRLPVRSRPSSIQLQARCKGESSARLVCCRAQPEVAAGAVLTLQEPAVHAIYALLEGAGSRRVLLSSIQHLVDDLERASAEAGLNKVDPAYNDGNFKGRLTTDLHKVSSDSETTLGRASFNSWGPKDLRIKILSAPVFKGHFEGKPNTYIIPALIQLVDTDLQAVSMVLGEYNPHPEGPTKLSIQFQQLRLQPTPEVMNDEAKLRRWIDFFLPHNPHMDPGTGVAKFDLVKAPASWMRYIYMDETWQVVQGSAGSVSVLKRTPGVEFDPDYSALPSDMSERPRL